MYILFKVPKVILSTALFRHMKMVAYLCLPTYGELFLQKAYALENCRSMILFLL